MKRLSRIRVLLTWGLLVLLLTLGLAAPAAAQGERGVIGGTVADAQGACFPVSPSRRAIARDAI